MDQKLSDPLIGNIFGEHYYIERLLGTGGMGSVYLAFRDNNKEQPLALKILHASLSREEKHVKRFLREVQITRKISHPNVVTTFDVGQHKGQLYFTMEYVEGISLKEKLFEDRLSIPEILRLLQEICFGLEAIHEGGIIHRDLKPGNILLSQNNSAKIADFGVASLAQAEETSTVEIVGSAGYMSPEHWRCEELNETSDIYSLGVMLYEMVTGIRPFDGSSATSVMHQHLNDPPQPPISDLIEIPTWLTALILMMLEKEPMKRPQSASEIISIIQSATHGSLHSAVTPDTDKASSTLGTSSHDRARKPSNASDRDPANFQDRSSPPRSSSSKIRRGLLERPGDDLPKEHTLSSIKGRPSRSSISRDKIDSSKIEDPSSHVHNPAVSLSLGFCFNILMFLLVMWPLGSLLRNLAGRQHLENLNLLKMFGFYSILCIAMCYLVSGSSLILGAPISSLWKQLLTFLKCVLFSAGFLFLIFLLHAIDFLMGSGVGTANLNVMQIVDILNASLTNLLEGALLVGLPTEFVTKLLSPAPRLLPKTGQDAFFLLKYFVGTMLYFFGILTIINNGINKQKGSLKHTTLYYCLLPGLIMLITAYILRPMILGYLPFDGLIPVIFDAGYFSFRIEMFSLSWAALTWIVVLATYFIVLIGAYKKELIDQAIQIHKLSKGQDPSKEIIGR